MNGEEDTNRKVQKIPILGTVNVDAHKGTIDLGDGRTLEDIPLVGKGSIIWRDLGDGCLAVDYEAMELRDAAIDAALN